MANISTHYNAQAYILTCLQLRCMGDIAHIAFVAAVKSKQVEVASTCLSLSKRNIRCLGQIGQYIEKIASDNGIIRPSIEVLIAEDRVMELENRLSEEHVDITAALGRMQTPSAMTLEILLLHYPEKNEIIFRKWDFSQENPLFWPITHNNLQRAGYIIDQCPNGKKMALFKGAIQHLNWASGEMLNLYVRKLPKICHFLLYEYFHSAEKHDHIRILIDALHNKAKQSLDHNINLLTCAVYLEDRELFHKVTNNNPIEVVRQLLQDPNGKIYWLASKKNDESILKYLLKTFPEHFTEELFDDLQSLINILTGCKHPEILQIVFSQVSTLILADALSRIVGRHPEIIPKINALELSKKLSYKRDVVLAGAYFSAEVHHDLLRLLTTKFSENVYNYMPYLEQIPLLFEMISEAHFCYMDERPKLSTVEKVKFYRFLSPEERYETLQEMSIDEIQNYITPETALALQTLKETDLDELERESDKIDFLDRVLSLIHPIALSYYAIEYFDVIERYLLYLDKATITYIVPFLARDHLETLEGLEATRETHLTILNSMRGTQRFSLTEP